MKKSVGFFIPEGYHLVYVYKDSNGNREADHNHPPAKASNMIGVFLASNEVRRTRLRRGRFYPEEPRPQGVSEGYSMEPELKWSRDKNQWVGTGRWVMKVCDWSSQRDNYKRHLQGILKKAQEFIAAGIDKKAAIIAARKCSCQVH